MPSYRCKLIQKHKTYESCPMCGNSANSLRYQWTGMLTGDKLIVCRDCAYRESFGTKTFRRMKKEKVLDKIE